VYLTPTFQDIGEEFAVNRGDLQGLNYTKTVFVAAAPSSRRAQYALLQP